MKKMPTIFERDWDGDRSRVVNTPNHKCAWVFAGDGVATRKYDGTSCMFDGSKWWKRREVKPGKPEPVGFVLVDSDNVTGKVVGWMPVDSSDKWHLEGIANSNVADAGTYELCGPKVQGNPEGFSSHVMVRHGAFIVDVQDRTFEGLREWLSSNNFEGIVFHHPDGRMAKIKARDFGMSV